MRSAETLPTWHLLTKLLFFFRTRPSRYATSTAWLVDCVFSQAGPTVKVFCGGNTKAKPNVYEDYVGRAVTGCLPAL